MNRKMTLLAVLSSTVMVVGVGAFVMSRRHAKAEAAKTASCGMPLGDKKAASRLPKGTVPMAAADQVDFTGKAVCGSCSWGIGEDCNTMLWDKDAHHVVAVMPNDKLAELQKLTGT